MSTDASDQQERDKKLRKIIIAVEDDVHTKRAIDLYLTQLKRPNDHVICVHVIEPKPSHKTTGIPIDSFPALLGTMLSIPDKAEEHGKELCREVMEQLKKVGVKAQSYLYVDVKPGSALSRACSELNASMIIMGSRGCGQMKRAILGSVSTHVLHHAHIPVIIVPPASKM